jgi:chaperone required for assembly of F1-ATPase
VIRKPWYHYPHVPEPLLWRYRFVAVPVVVVALMLAEGAIAPDAAFDATHLDELWQAELWGEEWMAADARALRRADFVNSARMLALLRAA